MQTYYFFQLLDDIWLLSFGVFFEDLHMLKLMKMSSPLIYCFLQINLLEMKYLLYLKFFFGVISKVTRLLLVQ